MGDLVRTRFGTLPGVITGDHGRFEEAVPALAGLSINRSSMKLSGQVGNGEVWET